MPSKKKPTGSISGDHSAKKLAVSRDPRKKSLKDSPLGYEVSFSLFVLGKETKTRRRCQLVRMLRVRTKASDHLPSASQVR
jgi:hypothetical protein